MSVLVAAIPVIVLVVLLALSVYLYGGDSSYGGNHVALLFAGAVGAIIAVTRGQSWVEIQQAVVHGIATATVARC